MIRFTVDATATALIDAARFKAENDLDVADTSLDAQIDKHIAGATGAINKICGRAHFGKATAEETIFGVRPGKSLWLSHWPVLTIASVVECGEMLSADAFELDVSRKLWRLDNGNRVSWSPDRVVVTYEGGYALPAACPDDLASVCIELTTASWSSRGRDLMLKSEDVPGVAKLEYWVGAVSGLSGGMSELSAGTLINYQNFAF